MIFAILKGMPLSAWIHIGSGLIIVLLGIYITFLKVEISYHKAKVQTAEEQLKTKDQVIERKQYEIDECLAIVDHQNSKVNELIEYGKTLQTKIDELSKKRKANKDSADAEVANIVDTPVPKTAEGALSDLNKFMKTFSTNWNKE